MFTNPRSQVRTLQPVLDALRSDCQQVIAHPIGIVLDNTYVSRKSRASVIESAARAGHPVRCVWLQTSLEDAQVNASSRMLARYGRLLGPEEMRLAARTDVSAFGPAVQFRHQREFEPPHLSEGFSTIDVVPFERRRDPSHGNRAVVLWCDDVLIRSRSGRRSPSSAEDVETVESHGEVLRMYLARGWQLLGLSWRPEIAQERMSVAEVEACFNRMIAELGVPIDVRYCPHAGGPPECWCRKPLPGLGALFIQQYRLDPAQSLYVGQGPQDPGFARRLGFAYREAEAFFGQTPRF